MKKQSLDKGLMGGRWVLTYGPVGPDGKRPLLSEDGPFYAAKEKIPERKLAEALLEREVPEEEISDEDLIRANHHQCGCSSEAMKSIEIRLRKERKTLLSELRQLMSELWAALIYK